MLLHLMWRKFNCFRLLNNYKVSHAIKNFEVLKNTQRKLERQHCSDITCSPSSQSCV
jgi:hypothetical protein